MAQPYYRLTLANVDVETVRRTLRRVPAEHLTAGMQGTDALRALGELTMLLREALDRHDEEQARENPIDAQVRVFDNGDEEGARYTIAYLRHNGGYDAYQGLESGSNPAGCSGHIEVSHAWLDDSSKPDRMIGFGELPFAVRKIVCADLGIRAPTPDAPL